MPSKGVQIYSYIAVPNVQIEFSVPRQRLTINETRVFRKDRLEIDKKNISGHFNFTGTFEFQVIHDGREIAKEFVNINTVTGNLESGIIYDPVMMLHTDGGHRQHEDNG